MRALIQHRYGDEHALAVEDVAVPEPGLGELRVRVEACGANASDWEFVTGHPAYARTVAGLFRPKGRTLGSLIAILPATCPSLPAPASAYSSWPI